MSPLVGEPPLLRERAPLSRADGGGRRQVVVGRAERRRVKVERERSERTLRRRGGANRRGRRQPEAARVHSRGGPGADADGPWGCGK